MLCQLSKSEILRLCSIVYVAMERTKTSHFTCRSKSFISIFFTCQVSVCELQPFSCHDLTNDIYSQTTKTVFSHLKKKVFVTECVKELLKRNIIDTSKVLQLQSGAQPAHRPEGLGLQIFALTGLLFEKNYALLVCAKKNLY